MAKRSLTFLFGLAAYAAFLFTVLYGICFIGDFFVQKTIDSGLGGNPAADPTALALDLAWIALFGFQHTLMARPGIKRRLSHWVPEAAGRSLFVLAASLCLLVLFWQWRPFGNDLWNLQSGFLPWGLRWLYGAGWLIVILSTFLIDHFDFSGLRQVYLYLLGRPYAPVPFKEHSLYKLVRHPMMLGLLICFWAAPRMSTGHFLFAAGMSVYILIGLAFEERDLLRSFGEQYQHYRQRVPMLMPRLREKRVRAHLDSAAAK